ncbi:MAG: ATP synthase F1 subunit gamma, partial [candidate division Zixibacteria bacterium RBG_16_40_9]
MESLKVIRRRIRSVTSTKQITKAMEMVAAARLRKAQARLETSRPYASKMQEILENLSTVSGFVAHPLFAKREVKKSLIILITSDRGLCGSYNSNLINFTNSVLSQYSPASAELGLIGRKGFDFYKRRSWPIRFNYLQAGGKIPFLQIKEITHQTVELFLNGETDKVFLIYTKFLSLITRKIALEKFLNIEKPAERKTPEVFDYIFEPAPTEIFNSLVPRYCITKIQMAI